MTTLDLKALCEVPRAADISLTVKDFEEDENFFRFRGMATTPKKDAVGDIVEPMGAEFSLPIKLLNKHDNKKPIGNVTMAQMTKSGIPYVAEIPKVKEAGLVKDRVDEAIHEIKYNLVSNVSIGFRAIEDAIELLKDGGLRFLRWRWHELSLAPIPANDEATITAFKSIDTDIRSVLSKSLDSQAASGARAVATLPGATGKTSVIPKGNHMKSSLQEQIASCEAKRAANSARMDELIDLAGKEGRTFTEEETQENKDLDADVKRMDDHLVVLRAAEKGAVASATVIRADIGTDPDAATAARNGNGSTAVPPITWGKSNLPKGTAFTRYALTLLRAKGDSYRAMEISKQWKDSTPEVELAIKAAVAVGNTTDAAWAAPLVVYQNLANEFVELLRPETILGKLTGVSRVPFNISIPRATAGTTSSWVGEDDPKPVSRMSLETITLGHTKIATIVLLSEELVQDSSPAAEELVRRDMIAAIAAYSDAQFIDPTVTASGAIRPASITNGLTTHAMTGTAIANVLTDVQTLMGGFVTANMSFQGAVWVMHPRTALYLSMLLSPLGTMQFPGINVNGGTFMGFPVITSASVPIDTGADSYIVLLSAPDILLAETGINVDVSREASVQADSAPSDSAASMISLWQKNLVGLRAERRICYRRRREAAVQVLSAVSY